MLPPGERRVAFSWDLPGRHFPSPLLRGSVGGVSTWMLVDTGASTHTIAAWLARKGNLAMDKLDEVGADHAGRSIATFRIDHPKIAIDGWGPLADAPVLAAEVPSQYEELGIGAFISPQLLVSGDEGAIVLDFVRGDMHAAGFDAAMHVLGRHGASLVPNGETACVDDNGVIPGLTFVLPAKVDGHSVGLLLDTGAEKSDVLALTPVGKRLEHRSVPSDEQLYAASGKMTARTVRGATVSVGDYAVRTDVALIPGSLDPDCPRDGVVSMDVLRACVLVLGKRSMAGRCGMR